MMRSDSVLILGLGISGVGVVNFCKSRNIKYYVHDDLSVSEDHQFDGDFQNICLVVKSPGLTNNHNVILSAKQSSIEVISDIEYFFRHKPDGLRICGITGSNGKSTTTSLLGHILSSNFNCVIAGNIGKSPFDYIDANLEFLILELSSYHLEYTKTQSMEYAVILNITPDHIDHHITMQNYIDAKYQIINLSSHTFVSEDGHNMADLLKQNHTGPFSIHNKNCKAFCDGSSIFIDGEKITDIASHLPGKHNVQNVLAAFLVAENFMPISDIIKAIETFMPLEHRIQYVKTISDIEFYNDSKATNVESTETAIASFADCDVYLIAGGKKKENGIEDLLPKTCFTSIRGVFLIGDAAANFASKIIAYNDVHGFKKVHYVLCGTLEKATHLAFENAVKSQSKRRKIVLLSPLCASFDQFKNYEERGRKFQEIVKSIQIA